MVRKEVYGVEFGVSFCSVTSPEKRTEPHQHLIWVPPQTQSSVPPPPAAASSPKVPSATVPRRAQTPDRLHCLYLIRPGAPLSLPPFLPSSLPVA